LTQQNFFLRIIEILIRSNFYSFIFARIFFKILFTKYIYDTDFKILKILRNNNYFNDRKIPIIDIGANDGISYKFIRNFLKKNLVYSFEPLKSNFKKLIKIKKKDENYKIVNCGLSNETIFKKIFIPYFKNYELSYFASLNKQASILRLKNSLFIKNLLNKIKFRSEFIKIKKLDNFFLKPNFIKIDIEGHEYECILGSIRTIKKSKPILLIEYNPKINKKIYNILKKIGYKTYYYDGKNDCIKLHKNKKVFNIIYVHNNNFKYTINNDNYKTQS
jgi:FkbM family methyltransferase